MNFKIKNSEFDHFSELASEWWLKNGKFKTLHDIQPIRIKYIQGVINKKQLDKFKILDVGCGGGLISEGLTKLKANVTGIDFVKENINIAKNHSHKSNLKINYKTLDFENKKISSKFDIIVIFEVLEHLSDWKAFIKKIHSHKSNLKINYKIQDFEKEEVSSKFDVIIIFEVLEHLFDWKSFILKIQSNLNTNGVLIISTINKNLISKFLTIDLAENFLKWIPHNTHNYYKFIRPNELEFFLIKNNFHNINFKGLKFDPFQRKWSLNKNTNINYFCSCILN